MPPRHSIPIFIVILQKLSWIRLALIPRAVGYPRQKPSLFYSSKKGKSAMIASYQLIINVIADYIEIVMLSIGMIVFLASE